MQLMYSIEAGDNMKLDEGMLSWHDFLSNGNSGIDCYVKRGSNDPAAIIYSGGTTGKPKGIIISNGNFNAMALQTKTVCNEIKPGNSVSSSPLAKLLDLKIESTIPDKYLNAVSSL